MNLLKRISNLWELSQIEIPQEEVAPLLFRREVEKAEFIMPNRVQEILEKKPGASLADVIKN